MFCNVIFCSIRHHPILSHSTYPILPHTVLNYAMLCYAMLCYAMLCCAMLYCATPQYPYINQCERHLAPTFILCHNHTYISDANYSSSHLCHPYLTHMHRHPHLHRHSHARRNADPRPVAARVVEIPGPDAERGLDATTTDY